MFLATDPGNHNRGDDCGDGPMSVEQATQKMQTFLTQKTSDAKEGCPCFLCTELTVKGSRQEIFRVQSPKKGRITGTISFTDVGEQLITELGFTDAHFISFLEKHNIFALFLCSICQAECRKFFPKYKHCQSFLERYRARLPVPDANQVDVVV